MWQLSEVIYTATSYESDKWEYYRNKINWSTATLAHQYCCWSKKTILDIITSKSKYYLYLKRVHESIVQHKYYLYFIFMLSGFAKLDFCELLP